MTTATQTKTTVNVVLLDEDYYEDSSDANTQDCQFVIPVSPEAVMAAVDTTVYEVAERATDDSPYVTLYTYYDLRYENVIRFMKGIEG